MENCCFQLISGKVCGHIGLALTYYRSTNSPTEPVGIGSEEAILEAMRNLKILNKISFLALVSILISCEQGSVTEYGPSPERLIELALAEESRSQVLVDSDWLASYAYYPDVHIVELGRTAYEFSQAHIPGAKFVDWRTEISDQSQPEKYNIVPLEEFELLMERLGITRDSTIVLYDTLSNRASARMYWTLKYYMHDSIKVLEGGLTAWQAAGRELTGEPTDIELASYKVDTLMGSLLVDMSYVLGILSDSHHSVVDGRPFDQYTGESQGRVYNTGNAHQRLGHIYGAQSVPWADNLEEDGTFKSTEELLELYEAHKIFRDKTVVTYCNEGFHAAMPWFVLSELLGYEDVRLYDSSMAEWGNLPDTPMLTGQHCM